MNENLRRLELKINCTGSRQNYLKVIYSDYRISLQETEERYNHAHFPGWEHLPIENWADEDIILSETHFWALT